VQIIRKGQQPTRVPPGGSAGLSRGIIVCGPGKPTAKDIEIVNAFAADLKKRKAREAAIEKASTPYFKLTCGHYGTRERDEIWRDWNTDVRNLHYCEVCWNWFKVVKAPRTELPTEPLF
jgi:hypothetical protein